MLRREIFFLWDLPGGGIEKEEAAEEAAVRECREETGYDIAIERFVGLYRHQSVYGRGDQLTHVFLARVTGGAPKHLGLEVTGLRWHLPSELPRSLQPLQHQMIVDALMNSATPFERRIEFPRWKLYPARFVFGAVSTINGILRRFL